MLLLMLKFSFNHRVVLKVFLKEAELQSVKTVGLRVKET